MKKEKVKKLCRRLGEKLHLVDKEPLTSIVVKDGQVYINGKVIDTTKLEDLVLLYRIKGWM